MAERERFTGPADDLAAIRALCERYCHDVIGFDMTSWGATWTDDACWVRSDATILGPDAIVAAATQIRATFDSADFVAHLNDTRVDGDRATGRCYHTEIFTKDGVISFYLSYYDDLYERTGGVWRFAERRFSLLETRRFRPA